jgi:hypothetical protein
MIETASQLGDRLADTQEKVGSLGQTAGKKFMEARRETANVLNDSACSVRAGGEAMGKLAASAAAKLDSGADCMRDYDLGGVLLNLRQVIRRHPAAFIAGAAAAGFLIARAARKT